MIYEYFFTFIKFVTLKHLFYNIFIYLYHVIYFSLNLWLTWQLIYSYSVTQT